MLTMAPVQASFFQGMGFCVRVSDRGQFQESGSAAIAKIPAKTLSLRPA
jgi:hypothetical protein